MPRPTIFFVLVAISLSEARGRYEFIEESDLPAFYSMRSAQMAQKAQLAPQLVAQEPYQQYMPYQMFQPVEVPPNYTPFAVYNPVYRGPAPPAPSPFQPARPAPVQYHPMAFYHPQAGQPQPPIGKKTARI